MDELASNGLLVSGWAFVTGIGISALHTIGFGSARSLQYGMRRADVADVYADEPNAMLSGFHGYLEVDEFAAAHSSHLEVWATLEDGRSIRLFRRKLTRRASSIGTHVWRSGWQVGRHPRLLLSRRAWRNALERRPASVSLPPDVTRAALALPGREARTDLDRFLASGSRLTVAASPAPVVSVVVVVWNHAELTLQCLRKLAAQADVASEVIVVDNASTDETSSLLARVDGLRAISNPANVGFTVSVNLGAKSARGDFLLLLNNDAEVQPGCLDYLLQTAGREAVGAVGGKLVFPDGRLQEAGSIVWSDGSCEAYGRGGDPAAPAFNFERPVDFCSAALLLTPRAVFERLGGFDERYRPAYYEDADYCARLWTLGYRVIYQPRAVAVHREFGSAASAGAAIAMQQQRRPLFAARHVEWLASQPDKADGAFEARSHPHHQPRVLVIDDAVPDPRAGAGFPRAAALLHALQALGYRITLYVTAADQGPLPDERFPCIEILAGGPPGLRELLTSRQPRLMIVSRPHNMEYVKAAIGSSFLAVGVRCIYDAEALYADREIGRRVLIGQPLSPTDRQALIDREIALARGCAAVLAVSEPERQTLVDAGVANVHVVAHAVEARPTPNAIEGRNGILFVGAFGVDSPNNDAVEFFCREVLPALRAAGCGAPVAIVGAHLPEHLKPLGDRCVTWHRDVDDLAPFYDRARVFIAPTRYGAGIALKVLDAAAHGIPIVGTPLVAGQLRWTDGSQLVIAERPEDFVRAITRLFADDGLWSDLRNAALARIALDYSPAGFQSALQQALQPAPVIRTASTDVPRSDRNRRV